MAASLRLHHVAQGRRVCVEVPSVSKDMDRDAAVAEYQMRVMQIRGVVMKQVFGEDWAQQDSTWSKVVARAC